MLPRIPDVEELRPFPTTKAIEYEGHNGHRVRCLSVSPTMKDLLFHLLLWMKLKNLQGFNVLLPNKCLVLLKKAWVVAAWVPWNSTMFFFALLLGHVRMSLKLVNPQDVFGIFGTGGFLVIDMNDGKLFELELTEILIGSFCIRD